jgi:ParB family chromosome partitioning protein
MAIIATLKAAEPGYAGNAHSIASIPLDKFVPWDGNVRKTGATDGLDELTASIRAHGVLQSLVVRKTHRGKFAIIAGRRRFLALSALAEEGAIAGDTLVPCRVIPGSADAAEISLTENVVRAPMHPADQFEAFRDLVDGGSSVADIAARFGISETAVKKRLKLARVSQVVYEAYRGGQLTLEQVQAFTVCDDHAAQERVLDELSEWSDDPDDIRSALTQDEITATDKRARFVTVAAYEEAGGAVRRDLFAEDDEGIFLLDAALLDRLALAKLESTAREAHAEGWKWVEVHLEFDYEIRSQFARRQPEPLPLSEEAGAEHKRLAEEYHSLYESMEEGLDAIEARIGELEETERAFTPETLAIAGAIVTIDSDGEAEIVRGLIRPEDLPPESAAAKAARPAGKPAISASLVEDLTAQRTAAISASLAGRPDIALAAVVHALAIGVFRSYGNESSLQLSARRTQFRESSKGADELELKHEEWSARLPAEPGALWQWCLAQSREVLLELLAFCAARSVNAVQAKQDRPDCPRLAHADALATALAFDMSAWFTPTAGNFFSRVSRTEILSALAAAKGAPAKRSWDKLKKSELAILAEREIAGTGWLPQFLKA